MSSQDLFLRFVHPTFVKKNFLHVLYFWGLIKMFHNFDVLYNTYKSKTIIDNFLIFPTIQALCTFNATKKNQKSLSHPSEKLQQFKNGILCRKTRYI